MLVLVLSPGALTDDAPGSGAALVPGAGPAIRRLNDAGHRIVALLARMAGPSGRMEVGRLARAEHDVREALRGEGARLDDAVAPPAEQRPEEPGGNAAFLAGLLRRYRAAAADTVLIADSLAELEAAAATGCRRILVRTGQGTAVQARGLPVHVLPLGVHADLAAAVEALLGTGP